MCVAGGWESSEWEWDDSGRAHSILALESE